MSVEPTVLSIWARELKLDDVDPTDDFFLVGGHSLIMTKIQQGIQAELGVEIPMDVLFRKVTVQQISAHIEELLAENQTENHAENSEPVGA